MKKKMKIKFIQQENKNLESNKKISKINDINCKNEKANEKEKKENNEFIKIDYNKDKVNNNEI